MRLIDADELIKRIGKWIPKDPCGREQTLEEIVATDIAASMYMEIEKTPTAFDKESVLANLQEELKLSEIEKERCITENPSQFRYANGYANGVSFSVEIVEKGGIE